MIRAQQTLRISHVGLRGVVGSGLTMGHAMDFAAAFGTFLEQPGPVLIARDPRWSGRMLREAVTAALAACGRDVIDLGIASTPVLQHAIRRRNAAGGVSIGASHNAADWNALKFFGPRGTYLSTAEAGELLDIYHLRKFDFVEWNRLGSIAADPNALDPYLDSLAAIFPLPSLRRFKVVVDCCNGTSSLILSRLNERFGFSFILINARTGAREFAHEPSTSAATVGLQLAPLIGPLAADAGFLFDVDSDRVALATEADAAVSEEMIQVLLADYQLERQPGRLVISNLSSTASLDEIASRRGGTVIRVPVGRQAAIDALAAYRPDQIALAGEGTGAVMLPQFRFVYDGIASMLAILSMMAERGQSLGALVASYPRYEMLKGEVRLSALRIPSLLAELRELYSDGRATALDGLRVDWPGRWFHVRVSQTEPIVRVIAEQKGEPPRALFESLMERVRSMA